MRKIILAGVLASVAFTASAQDAASPIGKWKTLDDKSGKPMTITEVYMAKNVTLWNLKANKDGSWGGGSGYKPSEDREFNAKSVKLVDGGKKLEVKGCVSIICRTATWVRAN